MATNDIIAEIDGLDQIDRILQTNITEALLDQLNDEVDYVFSMLLISAILNNFSLLKCNLLLLNG